MIFIFSLFFVLTSQADDVAAPTQLVGDHSTVATTDGSIRDDELIDFICAQILQNGGKVKDVKLMVNSCYGGGLLDDMERAFGPNGLCEGIPWVGGSASAPDTTARGWSDETVDMFPALNLGSIWTNGLTAAPGSNVGNAAGSMHGGSSSNNVILDLENAGKLDLAGPNGSGKEVPQIASGNGGDGIMWRMANAKHEAVVFGGLQTDKRHTNNIENVKKALEDTWGDAPTNIQDIDGGSSQDLKDAIATAAGRLDENTQLAIYIDDHGGSSFDFDEAIGGILDTLIEDNIAHEFSIPDGWFMGMFGNYFARPAEFPNPYLGLNITECIYCSSWAYYLNGYPLTFPQAGSDRTGLVRIPIPFHGIRPGMNRFEMFPRQPMNLQTSGSKTQTHNGSLRVSNMEISTGPINELLHDQLLLPGQSAAFFDSGRDGEGIFVELLDNGFAVVYLFTYNLDGSGQAWMVGLGEQVGEGIIVREVQQPSGATFGPGFDPADVVRNDFGALAVRLPTCGTNPEPGSLFVSPNLDNGYETLESFNYTQLSSIVDCVTEQGSVNSPLSGSWFDSSHDGEGIVLEVLDNGVAVVQWFTFDSTGKQMWVQGTGTFVGNTLTVTNLFTTQGTQWGSGFNAANVTQVPWGSVTMVFNGCGEATFTYQSTAGFGNGTLNMVRLTSLMGITCTE